MKSFITGSYAYGDPSDESDLDMVVFVTEDERQILAKLSDAQSPQVRYGKLNAIVCCTEDFYESWVHMTAVCVRRHERQNRPICKLEAKHVREDWCRANKVPITPFDYNSPKSGDQRLPFP